MRYLVALSLCLLGCDAPSLPTSSELPLRNPAVTVGSQADVTLARLRGDWTVVQGAGVPKGARLRFDEASLRLDGVSFPIRDLGQGRFDFAGDAHWVHWLDADNRTAAIGDPAGSRVWIMDRSGRPGERLQAARDILGWYGYDLSLIE